MPMSDSPRTQLNINLNKNIEDTVVEKRLCLIITLLLLKSKKCTSHLCREKANKKFEETK